jgi:D-serine dehydratase
MRLARHVAGLAGVSLAGLAAFEGVVAGSSDIEMEPHVEALFAQLVGIAEDCARADLFDRDRPTILSAGGSRFFDIAATRLSAAQIGRDPLVVLRSGCYISHDAHHYKAAFDRLLERTGAEGVPGGLVNALEVWAEIQSRPEPGWLYANLGKRDISHDIAPPEALASWTREAMAIGRVETDDLVVRKLSDQHAHLSVAPASSLAIGDQLGFGVSHPCTTFDKWRVLFEVDDDGLVLDAIATFF